MGDGWSGSEVQPGVVGVRVFVHESEIAEPFLGRPISVAAVRLSRPRLFDHACHASLVCLASFRIIADRGMWRQINI